MSDMQAIKTIARRAADIYEQISVKAPADFIISELWFVHQHVCRLRLEDLAAADDANLMHDVAGIHRHLNVERECFNDCFSPRFTA